MARQELNVFRMRLLGAEVRPALTGQPDAQGRRQRGHAGLGGHRRGHPLLPRLGDGPAPVSRGWCGSSTGSSATRRASSVVSRLGGAARRGHRPAWAAARTPSGIFAGFADTDGRAGRCRARRGRGRRPRRARAWSTACSSFLLAGRVRPGPRGPVDLRRTRLSRRRPRARPPARPAAGPATCRSPTTRWSRRFQLLSRTEGIIPALESAHAIAWMSRARGELAGQTRALQPVGSGRQGRRADDGDPRDDRRDRPDRDALCGRRRDGGRKGLVPYVTGGLQPDWLDVVRALADAGADAIEVGIPFSRSGHGRSGHPAGAASRR